jgi:endonuclease/exonuclease/phosphatase family metal-dependent hydrolase
MREEQFENTKWMNRKDRVKALIEHINADIVCLQEMRQLPDAITVNSWLGSLSKYRYQIAYRNASMLAFGQATLYDPKKFFLSKVEFKWLSDTPDVVSDTWALEKGGTTGFGYVVLCTQFRLVSDDGKILSDVEPFWVFNIHFGLEEELKTKSAHKLVALVYSVSEGQQFIISGDFNFFPDKDGAKQRAILAKHFVDCGNSAKTSRNGKQVEGTFIGYEHDQFKADLSNMVSRLDHVWCSKLINVSNPILHTETMLPDEPEELTTRETPSDHLPLSVDVNMIVSMTF